MNTLSFKYKSLNEETLAKLNMTTTKVKIGRKTKNNYLILKNEIIKENVDDNYIKYLLYSSKMIENNYLRIE